MVVEGKAGEKQNRPQRSDVAITQEKSFILENQEVTARLGRDWNKSDTAPVLHILPNPQLLCQSCHYEFCVAGTGVA
jgi:hypothetical protein